MLHLPTQKYEWAAFFLFWFGGLWLYYYELFIVSPYYHSSWGGIMKVHIMFGLYFAFNIYTNMFLMITTNISCKDVIKTPPSNPEELGWSFCGKCQIYTPPRSHHCKLCNACIIKRDHHCFFSGYCVGYYNHRYFMAMCVHMMIVAFYCNVYNWKFFIDQKGGFTWTTIPGLIAPQVGLLLGQYSINEFLLTAHTFVGMFLNFLFVILFCHQMKFFLTGQLHYERKKGIIEYKSSFSATVRDVFGSSELLLILCPLIPTKLSGDGITSFKEKNDKKVD